MALVFTNQHYSRTILIHHILAYVQLSLFYASRQKLMKYLLRVLVALPSIELLKDHRFSAFGSTLVHEQSDRVYHEAKSDLLPNVAMRQPSNCLDQGFVES